MWVMSVLLRDVGYTGLMKGCALFPSYEGMWGFVRFMKKVSGVTFTKRG